MLIFTPSETSYNLNETSKALIPETFIRANINKDGILYREIIQNPKLYMYGLFYERKLHQKDFRQNQSEFEKLSWVNVDSTGNIETEFNLVNTKRNAQIFGKLSRSWTKTPFLEESSESVNVLMQLSIPDEAYLDKSLKKKFHNIKLSMFPNEGIYVLTGNYENSNKRDEYSIQMGLLLNKNNKQNVTYMQVIKGDHRKTLMDKELIHKMSFNKWTSEGIFGKKFVSIERCYTPWGEEGPSESLGKEKTELYYIKEANIVNSVLSVLDGQWGVKIGQNLP